MNTILPSNIRVSETEPEPSICPTCEEARPYESAGGVCWVRKPCLCDVQSAKVRETIYIEDCKRRGEYLITVALKRTLIPSRFAGNTLNPFPFEVDEHNKTPIAAARKWSSEPSSGHGLYLFGPTGTGKTTIACAAVEDAIRAGQLIMGGQRIHPSAWKTGIALYLNLPHWLKGERQFFKDQGQNYEDASILVIDEIGLENTTSDFVHERIYDLVNHRYECQLPTVFTSNCTISEIAKRMNHPRISSRIAEMCKQVKVGGGDRRVSEMNVYRGGE